MFLRGILIILAQSVFLFAVVNLVKFFFFLWSYGFVCTSSSRFRAAALHGEYVSTYFLATSKEWFFSGFSYLAWCT